jgi:hypothetical protein
VRDEMAIEGAVQRLLWMMIAAGQDAFERFILGLFTVRKIACYSLLLLKRRLPVRAVVHY